jgi:hypothetical protein
MRVLYQPTQDAPADWLECDSADWPNVVSQNFPLHALCVQGVVFEGADHYSVESAGVGIIRVTVWYDDPKDWPPGYRWAREFVLQHLTPDANLGGAINTRHTQVVYAEPEMFLVLQAAYARNPTVTVRPWAAFSRRVRPELKGKWVSDEHHEAHQDIRVVRGWREWTEGLDPSELDESGRLKSQRLQGRWIKPKGTQTFYHNLDDLSIGAYAAEFENQLGLTATGVGTETYDSIKDTGTLVWAAASPAGRPGESAWPTTGTYRYQIDATAVGADCSFGLLTQGGAVGEFGRVSGDLSTRLQGIAQSQAAFTGSGWHVASITDPAWTSGGVNDRFVVAVAAVRIAGHAAQSLTLQLGETDDYTDGPWPEYVAATDNAVFFGTNF